MANEREVRDAPICVRLAAHERELVAAASSLRGVTLSDFLRKAAIAAAREEARRPAFAGGAE